MKFDLISDLHEDINKNWSLSEPNEGSEILVIAGDLAEYSSLRQSQFKTLRAAQLMYRHVIFVAGNHEFYGENYQRTINNLRSQCDAMEGVHFLHNNTLELDDIAFVGGTLFTDMNGDDFATKVEVRQCMADFTYITYGEKNPLVIKNTQWDFPDDSLTDKEKYGDMRTCTPNDYIREHRQSLLYFENECDRLEAAGKKVVLVTHHAMSEKSVMPNFAMDYRMNGGYRSRLDWFFEKHKNVAVHCHGHMHDYIRYTAASTRVYCNPFGYYRYEPKNGYLPLQIEV